MPKHQKVPRLNDIRVSKKDLEILHHRIESDPSIMQALVELIISFIHSCEKYLLRSKRGSSEKPSRINRIENEIALYVLTWRNIGLTIVHQMETQGKPHAAYHAALAIGDGSSAWTRDYPENILSKSSRKAEGIEQEMRYSSSESFLRDYPDTTMAISTNHLLGQLDDSKIEQLIKDYRQEILSQSRNAKSNKPFEE